MKKYRSDFVFLIENEYEDTTFEGFIYFYSQLCDNIKLKFQHNVEMLDKLICKLEYYEVNEWKA